MRSLWARLRYRGKPRGNLAAFAETEAFGARDLARAAEQVEDPWLRRNLIRHAQDEIRHAELLDEQGGPGATVGLGASLLSESQPATGVDVETLAGEIPFIAFVHMAEKRAVEEFEVYRDMPGEHRELFDQILRDERGHVAWTGQALERFERAGRGAEVEAAFRAFERGRWRDRWLAVARRVSWVVSALVLSAIFYVLLLPFRLLAGRFKKGWVEPTPSGALENEY